MVQPLLPTVPGAPGPGVPARPGAAGKPAPGDFAADLEALLDGASQLASGLAALFAAPAPAGTPIPSPAVAGAAATGDAPSGTGLSPATDRPGGDALPAAAGALPTAGALPAAAAALPMAGAALPAGGALPPVAAPERGGAPIQDPPATTASPAALPTAGVPRSEIAARPAGRGATPNGPQARESAVPAPLAAPTPTDWRPAAAGPGAPATEAPPAGPSTPPSPSASGGGSLSPQETLSPPSAMAAPAPGASAPAARADAPVAAPAVPARIADVARRRTGTVEQIIVRLDPPELGTVRIAVTARGDQVHVAVRAATPEARAAIEAQRERVEDLLKGEGFSLDSFDVGHQPDGDARQGHPGHRRPSTAGRPAFGFDAPDPAPAPSPAADGALRL